MPGLRSGGGAHPYVPILMEEAFKEAQMALDEGEVPVGCVLVHETLNKQLAEQHDAIATDDTASARAVAAALKQPGLVFRGRNATNRLRHALAHAEFVAMEALTAHLLTTSDAAAAHPDDGDSDDGTALTRETSLSHFVLYVTVEPCIMCASVLLYNRIGHVYFGVGNPRFGGNGTVLALHDKAHNRYGRRCEGCGEADNQEGVCGYSSEGGHRADDAIQLLQWFYERENPNAPGHKRRRKVADDDDGTSDQ